MQFASKIPSHNTPGMEESGEIYDIRKIGRLFSEKTLQKQVLVSWQEENH